MRKILALCSVSLLLSACNPFQPPAGVSEGEGDGEGFNEVMKPEKGEDDAMEKEEEQSMHVIEVKAENWAFSPNVIKLKKGEKVSVKLVGESGVHGFMAAGLGINQSISAGESMTVAIPTDKAGEFEFVCSIPCGGGHSGMVGQIIIEE